MKTLDLYLQKALTVCTGYYLAVYCLIGALRIPFPGALAWLESNSYYQMIRVLAGQALFVKPSVEYVPFPYPPFYFYASAALAQLTGPGFLPLRLISYFSSLGSMALIGYIVYRESNRRIAGLWAAGFFAATYNLSATYFDMGRVDSLFLFLFLGALTSARFVAGLRGCVYAAVLLTAATITKQTGLILCLPLMLYVFLFRPRIQAVCFTGLFILLVGLFSVWLNTSSGGWYFFYTFTLPARHQILWPRLESFWLQHIAAPLGITACMAILAFFLRPFKKRREVAVLYAPTLGAMIAASCMHWMKIAAYKNVLMPAHAALAIGAGLALAAAPPHWIRRLLLIAACIQCALLFYTPLDLLPSADNAQTVHRAIAAIKNVKGEVFAPANGYLAVMAGKKHSAHISPINDIILAGPGQVRDQLAFSIRDSLRSKRFKVILLDRKFRFFQSDVEANYLPSAQYADQLTFWPLIKFWCVPAPPQP